ncbi:MAG: hydrogen gas-evolving membrane-bound hydrogenase subunit E [Candidatus Hadarchaeales archaeon]
MKPGKLIAVSAVVAVALALILSTEFTLPPFGSFPSRKIGENVENSVAIVYLENAVEQTGAANVVTSIVWGYRGYDTLGEATILFAAVVGVLVLFRALRRGEK